MRTKVVQNNNMIRLLKKAKKEAKKEAKND